MCSLCSHSSQTCALRMNGSRKRFTAHDTQSYCFIIFLSFEPCSSLSLSLFIFLFSTFLSLFSFSIFLVQSNARHKELTRERNTSWKTATRAGRSKRARKSRASRNQESARETGHRRQDTRSFLKRTTRAVPTARKRKESGRSEIQLVKERAVDAKEDKCGTRAGRWTRSMHRKHRSTEQPAHDKVMTRKPLR